MRPTTAVSSANFTIWQLGCLAEQSYVSMSEQEGAQHTALWRASAEGDGGGDGVVDPDSLRSIGQEIQNPVPSVGLSPREESFCTRVCGMMVLKAEEKSRKSRRTLEFLLSKWVRAV